MACHYWIDFDEAAFWKAIDENECYCTLGTSDEYGIPKFEGDPADYAFRPVVCEDMGLLGKQWKLWDQSLADYYKEIDDEA